MHIHSPAYLRRRLCSACTFATFVFAFAQTAFTQTSAMESHAVDAKPAEISQTFFLAHVTDQRELNDIQTDLRNMLPHGHIFAETSLRAISVHGTPEDLAEAQKLIAELDKSRKVYRLTYTLVETDGDKHISTQHLSVIALCGEKTVLKQGSRVPIVTGGVSSDNNTPSSQVQYVDVGLNIEAVVEGAPDDLRLQTKIEQSALADEKSGLGAQDPVIRQTQLEGNVLLSQNKSLVVGSLDIPGTTRHEEVNVVAELIH
ncbi:MAG TPA: hypothetical protein VK716_14020 [Terracidiphilus sp.]|jgi:type II secretory pathway component GspD/PulD (secretin)|nr:hypothetical protein [Terracidiphilus sp.]